MKFWQWLLAWVFIGAFVIGMVLSIVYLLNKETSQREINRNKYAITLNDVVLDSKEEIKYYRAQNDYNLCFKKKGARVCITASNTIGETLMVGTKLNVKYDKLTSELIDYSFVEEDDNGSENATSN